MHKSWLLLLFVVVLPACERNDRPATNPHNPTSKAIALTWANYNQEVTASVEPVLLDFMSKG